MCIYLVLLTCAIVEARHYKANGTPDYRYSENRQSGYNMDGSADRPLKFMYKMILKRIKTNIIS